jgi:dolichol-phosphate mannosyltransferase
LKASELALDVAEPEPPRAAPRVSFVVPIFDEEEVLPLLLERLTETLEQLPAGSDVVLVNDGSRDRSLAILRKAARLDARVRVVDLSRNFGHAIAITCGLDHAEGDVVVVIDGDLQDPPELVHELIAAWRAGADIVHARRSARRDEETWFKRATAWAFYALMRRALRTRLPENVGEFRLMGRDVVLALRRLRERHRFVRGLVAWVGYRQVVVEYVRDGRAAGTTKFPLGKMVALAWDAITGFSPAPLKVASLAGVLALVGGTLYGAYAFYIGYWLGRGVPGWTSLMLLQVASAGVTLVCLGLIGEYVGRLFDEVKQRPLYFVRERIETSKQRERSEREEAP